MANELRCRYPTFGLTLYAVLFRATDGFAYKGTAFEAPVAADWAAYALPATEQDAAHGTGLYYATMPAGLPTGLYNAWFFNRVGTLPAPTDPLVSQQDLDWTGALEFSGAVTAAGGAVLASDGLDTIHIDGINLRQMVALLASALAGKCAVVGNNITFRSTDDSVDRITANFDPVGQRLAVTLMPPA